VGNLGGDFDLVGIVNHIRISRSVVVKSWRDFWKVHPAADVFPLIDADALRKLADDIEVNGLKVPVERRLTANGVYVIDGRNRLDALELAGIQLVDDEGGWLHPEYVHSPGKEFTDDEIASDVIGFNIHRRHLTKQEQVELIDKTLKAANVVSRHDGGKLKRPEGRPVDQHKAAVVEQAAKVGISERTVERALSKSADGTKAEPKKRRAKQPSPDPIPIDPAFSEPVSQLEVSGVAPKTVEWWAAECNLAQAYVRIARDGLRLVKEREQLKKAKKARDLQKQRD
jgi:hypothetical protein